MLKLNLGCGSRRRDGFLNVDSQAGCQPDLVLDLEATPWPWPDDSVDEIELIHVLEHLGQAPAVYLAVIKELWRVCCDGALVRIVVPHPLSEEFLNDPTHVRPVTESGLEMFSQRANAEWEACGAANTPLGRYLGIDFEIESASLDLKPLWLEKLQRGEVSEAEVRLAGQSQFNVFSQQTVLLRAVKPAGRLVRDDSSVEAATQPQFVLPDWFAEKDAAIAEGDGGRAIAILQGVLARDPGDQEARAQLATVLHAVGDLQGAYDNYQEAARAGFGGYQLHNNLGVAALELGLADAAVVAFERAGELAPGDRMVKSNLAEALGAAGRIKDAVATYEGLIQENSQDGETYIGLAKLFISQGWFADALQALDMARLFGLDDAEALNQRGIACRELGRYQEALAAFGAGLEKVPGNIPLLTNQANAYARLGRDVEAEAVFREALAIAGEACPEELGFSFACFLLKRGRTDEGWAYYETRRLARGVQHHALEQRLPQWLGEPMGPDAALLITAEQGFGDNLQFLRLVPAAAARFGRVTLQTRPALQKLLARSLEGVCEVVEAVAEDAVFDCICPIASLARALGLPVGDWGMAAPYLKADSMQTALWGFRIPAGRLKKVGLCWGGGKALRFRHRCDLPLAVVETLLAENGVRWVCLQKAGDEEWRRQQVQAERLVDLMDLVANFDDTAALVANLDLVITVDTSVAHVAGALGKPVWLLLAQDADWRWLEDREDSPWYPSLRIFRQRNPEDWSELGVRVLDAVKALG